MAFLKEDEYFLLMDIAQTAPLDDKGGLDFQAPDKFYGHISEDGLKMLYDVGIRTTMPFVCDWGKIEPKPGVYDWAYLDNYVDRATKVGMKVLLFNQTHYPDYFPDDWYVWDVQKKVHKEALSPWCAEAQNANNNFMKMLVNRYTCQNVMVANAHLRCGETVMLNEAAFYDPHAIASYKNRYGSESGPVPFEAETEEWLEDSYIEMLVKQQSILIRQPDREIWVMLHPAIANFQGLYGNGNKWIESILLNLRTRLEPSVINHIYYTWIQWPVYWNAMNSWRIRFGENVFGGGEYTEGLRITTPAAIQNGLRGQILAPCYPGIHDKVEPWMLQNIQESYNQWNWSKFGPQ